MVPQGVGPLWRDMLNMTAWDGQLQRRDSLLQDDDPGDISTAYTTPAVAAEASWQSQIPRLIVDLQDQDRPTRLIVTTREIFLYQSGSWVNMTPLHLDTDDSGAPGTVSVTNGTKAVTGTGTDWGSSKRAIQKGNWIELPKASGNWYQVDVVGSDTSITLLNNFAGTTLTNDTYKIRRAFLETQNGTAFNAVRNFFAQVFDGILYIAGAFGEDGDFMVLKIPDIFDSTHTATDVEILTGGLRTYASGIDNLGYKFRTFGLQVAETGHIFVAGRAPAATSHTSRIVFSSNISDTVWTTTPAGASDVVSKSSNLSAFGRNGFDFTIHYPDGIILAALTGSASQPLSFRPSRAEYGSIAPHALRYIDGVEVFPSNDFNIRTFNGGNAPVLTTALRKLCEDHEFTVEELTRCHASHYEVRDEYRLYIPQGTTSGGTRKTVGLYVSVNTGEAYPQQWGTRIGAALHRMLLGTGASPSTQTFSRYETTTDAIRSGVVGVPNWMSGLSSGEIGNDLLRVLDETKGFDDPLAGDSGTAIDDVSDNGGVYAESDYLDNGLPGNRRRVQRAVLVHRCLDDSGGTAPSLKIRVSYDGGKTWIDGDPTLTLDDTQAETQAIDFTNFAQQSGENYRIKLEVQKIATGVSMDQEYVLGSSLIALALRVVELGPIEAQI